MHPTICQIGPITVYSYGAMLAVAVMVCAFLLQKDFKKAGYDPDIVFDFVFWIVLSGLIGCRIFFILLNFPFFLENPVEIFMLQKGGLAWQGGLTFGFLGTFIFMKRKAMPFPETLDLIAPYIALGQSIGRIGCFLNGCCYGREVPWGIYFPVHGARLHPTQLYSSVGLLLIFFVLKKFQKTEHVRGQVLAYYVILSSLQRFIVEFFRADHVAGVLGLSIFQVVSLSLLLIGLYANSYLKRRRK